MLIPKVTLREDGILHFIYPPGMKVTAAMMEDVLYRHKVLAPNRKSPILVELERGDPLDREVSAFIRRPDVAAHTLSMAIVTSNRIGVMLANIFLKLSSFAYPSRLFLDKNEAIAWLRETMEEGDHFPKAPVSGVQAAEYYDFGSQANHLARLYFALDDAVHRLENPENQVIRDVEKMQMRSLAHDMEMELEGIRPGSRLSRFLSDSGFEQKEVQAKLDRFHELTTS